MNCFMFVPFVKKKKKNICKKKIQLLNDYISEFLIPSIPIKQSKIYHNFGTENDKTMILVAKWFSTL